MGKTCIVYSPNREKAYIQLSKIFLDKISDFIMFRDTGFELMFLFKDETWFWKQPVEYVRGYRPHKVYIDKQCDLCAIRDIILPTCIYSIEINFFGGD